MIVGVMEWWSIGVLISKTVITGFRFLMLIERPFCRTKAEFHVSITPQLHYPRYDEPPPSRPEAGGGKMRDEREPSK